MEPNKVKSVLKYIDGQLTVAERDDLKKYKKTLEELKQTCQDVSDRCMESLHDKEIELNIYKGGETWDKRAKAKPNVTGFAQRIMIINKLG